MKLTLLFNYIQIIICWTILLPTLTFAQQTLELNVCFSKNETELVKAFKDAHGKAFRATLSTRSFVQRLPSLQNISFVQSLTTPESTYQDNERTIDRIFTLQIEPADRTISSIINELKQSNVFDFVEENHTRKLHQSEPIIVNDDSISSQWYHEFIETFEAWEITRGNPSVRIGFIDTGIEYQHPEFIDQTYINSREDINGNGKFEPWPVSEVRSGLTGDFDGLDNDGNGYIDDISGYDFVDQPGSVFAGDVFFEDGDPTDDNGHGTEVAGVIGAKPDNGVGGIGIAPACKMVPLRAFGTTGTGQDDDIARSIIYAALNQIEVLNMSFGDIIPSFTLEAAIQFADQQNVIMVSSAGNGTGDELHYPSGYDEVISVSASTTNFANGDEFLWPLSSFGLTVDLTAPGSDIFVPTLTDTTVDGAINQFRRIQGTSFSAPMVSAAAALLLSGRNRLDARQIRGILTSTTDDLSTPGWDHFTGAGRLNLRKALEYSGSSRVQITSPSHDSGSTLDEIPIIGTVLNPEFLQFHVEWQAGTEGEDEWNTIIADQIHQVKEDTIAMWDISELPDGEYTLRIRLEKTNGTTSEDRIRFIRDVTPPEIVISQFAPIWENQERKFLIVFRSSDQARHTLFFRKQGDTDYQQQIFDRPTRNGFFLLDQTQLSDGTYECFIEMENLSGEVGTSSVREFSFQTDVLPSQGFNQLSYHIPMGRMLNRAFDFDQDSLKEVVMTRYDENLGIRNVIFLEFNGAFFQQVDSVEVADILLVKDVEDADQDGLWELLTSVNDSTYILEQENPTAFPKATIYTNQDNTLFPSEFADTDNDGEFEVLFKDFRNYFIYEREGDNYTEAAILKDTTPDYSGSIAPRTIVDDFDQDGLQEIIFGDRDGDFIVYEHEGQGIYDSTFIDTTELTRGGTYLTAGDFDGDGQQEFFIAVHSSDDRNADFEYDPSFWWLRIFKAVANDTYMPVWEDYIYEVETERFNAATAGNLDDDPADELVFTSFPKTYVLEYINDQYTFSWFHLGSIATHHIIEDFNGNGIKELGLGLGDSTYFFEKDVINNGPSAVNSLRGTVLGPSSVQLSWLEVPNATAYRLVRVRDPLNNSLGQISTGFTGNMAIDQDLVPEELYLYSIIAVNETLTPPESEFGNPIFLRPHERPHIDSIAVENDRQLTLFFTEPVVSREEDKFKFVLNDTITPISLLSYSETRNQLLLSFQQSFLTGTNQLFIDSTFLDRDLAYLQAEDTLQFFTYEPVEEEFLIIQDWEVLNDKEVKLTFNFPLDEGTALDNTHYTVSPIGAVSSVRWGSEDEDAVIIELLDARIGALGYAVSISAQDVCAINGVCLGNEGNTATFSSHKNNLSEVFVYPNPVSSHSEFDGLRFANLTQQATIRIFSASGRLVQIVEEDNGDGGINWNLKDREQQRIKPGVYLFHVTTQEEGVEEFLGKFSVVE